MVKLHHYDSMFYRTMAREIEYTILYQQVDIDILHCRYMWQTHTIRDIHGSNNYHKLRGDALPANDAKRERHGKHTSCKQTFGNGEPILTHL